MVMPWSMSGNVHGDIAACLRDLMTKTPDFHKFTAQGGDWGAEVASVIGRKYPASLCGVHQNRAAPLNCDLHEYSALAEMKKGAISRPQHSPMKFSISSVNLANLQVDVKPALGFSKSELT